MEEIVVIGLGNILLKDDGIGIHVINELIDEGFPSTIKLVDGGTSTLDMLGYFVDFKKVFVIDALKAGYKPGTIYRIDAAEIKNYKKENLSIHDIQILDVIKMANMLGSYPEVVIFGVEPKEIDYGLELSPEIKANIPDIKQEIKKEIGIDNRVVFIPKSAMI